MKSNVRGFGVLDIVIVLACLGGLFAAAASHLNTYQSQRQTAYESAKKEALDVASDWAPVINAMGECHQQLGLNGIDQVAGKGDSVLYSCPDVVAALRAQKGPEGDPQMLVKWILVKRTYETGFWRGVSPAIYAEAKGEPVWTTFLM